MALGEWVGVDARAMGDGGRTGTHVMKLGEGENDGE